MAGGFWKDLGTATDDIVRLAVNGITFGQADRLAAALGEEDTAAKTAAAAQRAGFVGDVAGAVGMGGGAGFLWKGAKQLPKIVRAAPRIARAAVSKKGLAGAGIGTAALYNYEDRTGGAQAAESRSPRVVPAQPKPRVSAAPDGAPSFNSAGTRIADQVTDEIMGTLAPSATPTFASMAARLAEQQGGGLSMRQLSNLADISNKLEVSGAGKPPGYKEVAGQQVVQSIDTAFAVQQAKAQALREAGRAAEAQQVWDAAYAARQEALKQVLGANAVEEAFAAQIRASQGQ
jgi:hypothetical protein